MSYDKYLKYKNKYSQLKKQLGGQVYPVINVGSHPVRDDELKESKNYNECSICYNELKENLSKLQCGHIFHISCIDEWRKRYDTCPNCRKTIKNIYKKYNDNWLSSSAYIYNVNVSPYVTYGDRSIPDDTIELFFGDSFNKKISPGVIPESVKTLIFGHSFNQNVEVGVIPKNVINLTFGRFFNKKLEKDVIPKNVINLTFGYSFNQELVEGVIPASVKNLTFGLDFNQVLKVGDIPYGVTHLTFSEKFDQELKTDVIPASVTHLTFGLMFDQKLKVGDIPASVTHLTFGRRFNEPLYVETSFLYDMYSTLSGNYKAPISLIPNIKELILKRNYIYHVKLEAANPNTHIQYIK